MRGVAVPLPSRVVVATVVVGVLAFAAGARLGPESAPVSRLIAQPLAVASPPAAPPANSPAAIALSSPSTQGTFAVPIPARGASMFARQFDPARLLATVPSGEQCSTRSIWTGDAPDGVQPSLARVWASRCQIPADRRAPFVDELGLILSDAIRIEGTSTSAGDSNGTIWLWPYRQGTSEGTIVLSATFGGPDLQMVVSLVERTAPARSSVPPA
jgi:hypothetical protein